MREIIDIIYMAGYKICMLHYSTQNPAHTYVQSNLYAEAAPWGARGRGHHPRDNHTIYFLL